MRFKAELPDYILIRESAQSAQRNCIDDIAVWVFGGASMDKNKKRLPGQWKRLEGVEWNKAYRPADRSEPGARYSQLKLTAPARSMLAQLMVPLPPDLTGRNRRGVLQARCVASLSDPNTVWSADMDCTDPWVFPLEIRLSWEGNDLRNHPRLTFQRPKGEKGEVPDWDFLAKNFKHKGYISAREAITGRRDSAER